MATSEQVRALVEPIVTSEGLELIDVEVAPRLLRVTVDRPGGVDLDAISDVTQLVSAALDRADPVPGGSYALEVSSPGLERPLRTPEHFQRFVGTLVNVKTHPGVPGERRMVGHLVDADDDGFTLHPRDGSEPRRFAYDDVDKARTVFEWGPSPKPGKVGGRPKRNKENA